MKAKKIFFIANATSIHTVKWVDYFIDRGYDVYLGTFSLENYTACKNIFFLGKKTICNNGGNYHYLFSILKLAKLFKQIKPDSINAHYSYSMGTIGLLAVKIAKIQTNFSVVCHGSDILIPPLPYIFDKINRYVLKQSDKIFVVSNQINDKIKEFNIDDSKIFVGQYGIKFKTIDKFSKDIDILSNRAYKDNSQIDFLLESLESFKDKKLKIVFIVPSITDSDFVKISSQYTHIDFYKTVEYSKMIELISRTKIYISATQSDGTSLSLLEAMHYNTIPLVSNIISNRSWILDGINGFLFNNKVEFTNKIVSILSLKEREIKDINLINNKLLDNGGNYYKQMKKIEKFIMENL